MNNDEGRTTPKAVLVISGTSSGVGKTTVTVGLMAAFASRGYIVQPFKCGPDFLDGMHHEEAIRTGEIECARRQSCQGSREAQEVDKDEEVGQTHRKCVNLDSWMMGSSLAMIQSFHRHSIGADICIIEGCMGLHDSKDGVSDDGSTAHIAKLLNAPVVLVIDGSMMARSVAAMALGYTLFDKDLRLGSVVVNKVGGPVHVQWIHESIEKEGRERLRDSGTGQPVFFAGSLPNDIAASIPERHLGLTMPSEEPKSTDAHLKSERFIRLALLVESHLDLDALFKLGQTSFSHDEKMKIPQPIKLPKAKCRIGIAEDEAFCFYYRDNLHLLQIAGAELIPFSPIRTPYLPPRLDGLYMGGGYPELHAVKLEANVSLRKDILSFSKAGGTIFAECGGFMYLTKEIIVSKDDVPRNMCGVFPISVRMTPHAKMYWAEIEFSLPSSSSTFPPIGGKCRGQRFHHSEVVLEENNSGNEVDRCIPFLVTPLLPGAKPEEEGYSVNNTVASYFHLHFSSFVGVDCRQIESGEDTIADYFIKTAIATSPYLKAHCVSFVSVATEIIFALDAQSSLAGVTSVCDFPPDAQCSPRQIICRSPIDASSMSSEDVDNAMQKLKLKKDDSDGPPGHWLVDVDALRMMRPKIVFVQNTCDICDPSTDDVLHALSSIKYEEYNHIEVIQVSPTTLEEMFQAIQKIAAALDIKTKGDELVQKMRRRLQRIETEVKNLDSPRPRVLSLEGLAPLCAGGHWLPDVKHASGCVDALGDKGGCPARIITWDEILQADPDILVISPCSASPARTLNEIHLLGSTSEFWKLRCVQSGEIYIFDHGCFSSAGPRLVEGAEMMAALFRNISPPILEQKALYSKWKSRALKYQCQTKIEVCANGMSDFHRTAELSEYFTPCFDGNDGDDSDINYSQASLKSASPTLNLSFARCTPNTDLPSDRSAHCIMPIHRRNRKALSLLLFGGENQEAKRLDDTWELRAPAIGWSALDQLNENNRSVSEFEMTLTWTKLKCSRIAGENVPTPRSNHAMVACGEHIMVFGGWSIDNMTPLSHCELLHSDSLCWTHCSTRGSFEPGPRGNPTLVYVKKSNNVVLFGGWDGFNAKNDLWFLDMNSWQWFDMTENTHNDEWPSSRTDHTSVLWEREQEEDVMLVFGGNVEGHGPCSELWAMEFNNAERLNNVTWRRLTIDGPSPPARTSHTADIVGRDNDAKMVIVGGTTSERGTGPRSMLCDAWILELSNAGNYLWRKLSWSGSGLNRCRHSMVVVDNNKALWWGGYDGEAAVSDGVGIWIGHVDGISIDDSTIDGFGHRGLSKSKKEEEKQNESRLQERWQAEVPMRQVDLPPEILEKANSSRLPGALFKTIHRYAVAQNRDTYIDPASGYSVFTTIYLKKRPCCGNGCRHCPHGHINVPDRKKLCDEKDLDW